jgi:hypothetical protein
VKHRNTAAAAASASAAAKHENYQPAKIAFGMFLPIAAQTKMILIFIDHGHLYLF